MTSSTVVIQVMSSYFVIKLSSELGATFTENARLIVQTLYGADDVLEERVECLREANDGGKMGISNSKLCAVPAPESFNN